MQNKLEPSWKNILDKELCKSYFKKLSKEIGLLYDTEVVYPTRENIFTAFKLCPFEQVKVVILGQDPYHGEGQAQGLSFSVPDGVRIPPSLQNIYQEIKNDPASNVRKVATSNAGQIKECFSLMPHSQSQKKNQGHIKVLVGRNSPTPSLKLSRHKKSTLYFYSGVTLHASRLHILTHRSTYYSKHLTLLPFLPGGDFLAVHISARLMHI